MEKLINRMLTIAKEVWQSRFTGDYILSFNQGGFIGGKKYPHTNKEIIRP